MELSIEEKAQRYDETINKLRRFMEQGVDPLITRADAQDFFPELKDNEDERKRKGLIEHLKELKEQSVEGSHLKRPEHYDAWIAWIEKQGEHANFRNKIQVGDKVTRNENGELVNLSQLERVAKTSNGEKQPADKVEPKFKVKYAGREYNVFGTRESAGITFYGIEDEPNHIAYVNAENCEIVSEQKPTDKVEPKFCEGDWVVYKCDICKIVKREEGCNKLVTNFGIEKELVNERNLSTARLWTIQDAKDGDILYSQKGGGVEAIHLIRGWEKIPLTGNTLLSMCTYRMEDNEIIAGGIGAVWWESVKDKFTPATKEQRELLFQKMREAGYEWDAEKKELKKIEQKPAWSEEDEEALEVAIIALEDMYNEDSPLDCYAGYNMPFDKAANQLKSLKDRLQPQTTWKPSDEQMEVLNWCKPLWNEPKTKAVLESLIEDLKKLMEG